MMTFKKLVYTRYKEVILEDASYLPERFHPDFSSLKDCREYDRLVSAIAEWFTLIELSEDLVQRVADSQIMHFHDVKGTVIELRKKWEVRFSQLTFMQKFK